MASGTIRNRFKIYDFTNATNANGDLGIPILYQQFVGGFSLTTGANAQFRISGGRDTMVAHFTDNSNQNIANTSVTARIYYV